MPEAQAGEFQKHVEQYEGAVKKELAAAEPALRVQAAAADLPARVMDEGAQHDLINALYGTPQGVMRMSDAVPGLVETSTNMGIVRAVGGELEVVFYSRSSLYDALDDVGQQITSAWEPAGIDVSLVGRYPGWDPDPDSPILGLMQEVYQDLYGQEAGVEAVHAGLECSVIGAKYPEMDMISVGPTLLDVHTPDERLEVATVASVNILGQVARKAGEYETRLIMPNRDPIVMTVAQEVVREALTEVGRPDLYDPNDVYYTTQSQFGYAAAVCGTMMRERPATNFFIGHFYAESLILAETGQSVGAIQIAGTADIPQLPFFVTACDYTLLGEELYAASAYLSKEPVLLGSIKAQDIMKAVIMFYVGAGIITYALGSEFFRTLLFTR